MFWSSSTFEVKDHHIFASVSTTTFFSTKNGCFFIRHKHTLFFVWFNFFGGKKSRGFPHVRTPNNNNSPTNSFVVVVFLGERTKMAQVGNSYRNPLTHEQEEELKAIAKQILQPGKGILAADESTSKLLILFSLGIVNFRHDWKSSHVDQIGQHGREPTPISRAAVYDPKLWCEH